MEPFKNLLGVDAAKKIALALTRAYPHFPIDQFLTGLVKELEPLELKARMLALKSRLIPLLPSDPKRSFPLLVDSLQTDEKDNVGLEGFLVWPLTQIVAEQGLSHFELSMKTLHSMTQVFTAEFAIRPFFIHEENKTLKQFSHWCQDPDENVRRLVSEGSRPLLPWGERLPSFVKDPEKTWVLLHELRKDQSNYVQKSVANHINDHTKNHEDWVIKKLKLWKEEVNEHPKLEWIIRHGTRTLIKKGHPKAFQLLGIKKARIKILAAKIKTPNIRLGQKLKCELTLMNQEAKEVECVLDHEISFLKSNGKHNPKVFKGKKVTLEPKQKLVVECLLPIRKVTTRTYFFGKQFWTPLLNGAKGPTLTFQLKE
jgi:3-methyladenine DNA glycosylase AlkC